MTRRLPRLFRTAGIPLVGLAFFALAGGHWAILQSFAWAQMVRDYSKTVSITEAIARTFSGKYPCDMCTRISAERQNEEKAPAVVKVEKKAEICPLAVRAILRVPADRDYAYPQPRVVTPIERAEAPPLPVPIFQLPA